jgi:hypothetical protein
MNVSARWRIFRSNFTSTNGYYHVGLNGLVYRFLTANNIAYWTNLQPPPETFIGRVLPVIELLAFIGLGYINARRNPQNTQGKAALFSLWIAGILLTAPITWWHYTTWLLMGMPTLIKFALHTKRRLRLLLVIGLLLINLSPYVMLGIGLLSGSHVLAYALLALPCLGLIIICLFFWIIQAGTRLNRVDAPADAN